MEAEKPTDKSSETTDLETYQQDVNQAQLQLMKNIFFYEHVMKNPADVNIPAEKEKKEPAKRVEKEEKPVKQQSLDDLFKKMSMIKSNKQQS